MLVTKQILFRTDMVQATLEDLKTNTRRICVIPDGWEYDGYGRITSEHPKKGKWGAIIRKGVGTDFPEVDIVLAKYQVGDILWVRETWARWKNFQGEEVFVYRADNNVHGIKWKPSIFMPKKAARIFLRVTNVRVEKLQDISVKDIIAEGFPMETLTKNYGDKELIDKAIEWFKNLWNSLAKEGYKWEDNPYVFVYEFEKVEKPC